MKLFILGVVVGVLAPFLVDFALFGDFTPCEPFKSNIENLYQCKVRG